MVFLRFSPALQRRQLAIWPVVRGVRGLYASAGKGRAQCWGNRAARISGSSWSKHPRSCIREGVERPTESQLLSRISEEVFPLSPDPGFPALLGGWGAGTGGLITGPSQRQGGTPTLAHLPLGVGIPQNWGGGSDTRGSAKIRTNVLNKCLLKQEVKKRKREREEGKKERANLPKAQEKTTPRPRSSIRTQVSGVVHREASPSLGSPSFPVLRGLQTQRHHHRASSKPSCFTKCFHVTALPTPPP